MRSKIAEFKQFLVDLCEFQCCPINTDDGRKLSLKEYYDSVLGPYRLRLLPQLRHIDMYLTLNRSARACIKEQLEALKEKIDSIKVNTEKIIHDYYDFDNNNPTGLMEISAVLSNKFSLMYGKFQTDPYVFIPFGYIEEIGRFYTTRTQNSKGPEIVKQTSLSSSISVLIESIDLIDLAYNSKSLQITLDTDLMTLRNISKPPDLITLFEIILNNSDSDSDPDANSGLYTNNLSSMFDILFDGWKSLANPPDRLSSELNRLMKDLEDVANKGDSRNCSKIIKQINILVQDLVIRLLCFVCDIENREITIPNYKQIEPAVLSCSKILNKLKQQFDVHSDITYFLKCRPWNRNSLPLNINELDECFFSMEYIGIPIYNGNVWRGTEIIDPIFDAEKQAFIKYLDIIHTHFSNPANWGPNLINPDTDRPSDLQMPNLTREQFLHKLKNDYRTIYNEMCDKIFEQYFDLCKSIDGAFLVMKNECCTECD